ncbi:MAG: DUF4931 domain-containing protein [Clostridiales bacterium]|nr:DUF4931 domain-containing protein [Clostridiales bacterium]
MLKYNYLTGTPVYIAEERLNRPNSTGIPQRKAESSKDSGENCPFCPHNAHMTPPVIYDNGVVKIVPNLYPFISQKEGLGFHDVVIDTPNHNETISDYTREHMENLLSVLKMRQIQLEEKPGIEYVQVFKNNGRNAGASQSHSHWQIGAQNIISPKISYMYERLKEYKDLKGKSYFDSEDAFISVWENTLFKIAIPTDSLFSFETHIITKEDIPSLTEFSESQLSLLAEVLLKQLSIYKKYDSTLDFNICFYSTPKKYKQSSAMRFSSQFIPRKGNIAGFEFSTGCYINSVTPEALENLIKKEFL